MLPRPTSVHRNTTVATPMQSIEATTVPRTATRRGASGLGGDAPAEPTPEKRQRNTSAHAPARGRSAALGARPNAVDRVSSPSRGQATKRGAPVLTPETDHLPKQHRARRCPPGRRQSAETPPLPHRCSRPNVQAIPRTATNAVHRASAAISQRAGASKAATKPLRLHSSPWPGCCAGSSPGCSRSSVQPSRGRPRNAVHPFHAQAKSTYQKRHPSSSPARVRSRWPPRLPEGNQALSPCARAAAAASLSC